MSLFNDEQLDYMKSLSEMAPATKCWCGWYPVGECYNCTRDPRVSGKTCADKLALRCHECGSTPSVPEWPVFHYSGCSCIRPIVEAALIPAIPQEHVG